MDEHKLIPLAQVALARLISMTWEVPDKNQFLTYATRLAPLSTQDVEYMLLVSGLILFESSRLPPVI